MKLIKLVFLIFVLIAFLQCESEEIEPKINQEEDGLWREIGFFGSRRILLNSQVQKNQIVFAGATSMVVIEDSLKRKVAYPHQFNAPLLERPAIYKDYILYKLSPKRLILTTSIVGRGDCRSPSDNFAYIFNLTDLDSTLYSENSIVVNSSNSQRIGVFNSLGQFVFVSNFNPDPENRYAAIDMIDYNFKTDSPDFYDISCTSIDPTIKRLYYPNRNYKGFVENLYSFDEDIYVQLRVGTPLLHIDTNGTVTENNIGREGNIVRHMFEIENQLYALTAKERLYKRVANEKINWELVDDDFYLPQSKGRIRSVFGIENRFGMTTVLSNRIFTRTLSDTSYLELNSNGLKNIDIRNVDQFDGKLWITSLNGLFFADINSLLSEK
ncbi:MAG: hypothetical protein AAGI07_03075 [Bacteroidota bacterium]